MDWLFTPQLQHMMNSSLEPLPEDALEVTDDRPVCRMMEYWWFKYPEPCYWEVTRVKYSEIGGRIMPKAWGILTWRGMLKAGEKEIPNLHRRRWMWFLMLRITNMTKQLTRSSSPIFGSME